MVWHFWASYILFSSHIWINSWQRKIPAGIFLPTIGIGACLGRAMGLIMCVINQLWIYVLRFLFIRFEQAKFVPSLPNCLDLLVLSSRSFCEMHFPRLLCRHWRFCDACRRNENDKCVNKLSFNKCPLLLIRHFDFSISGCYFVWGKSNFLISGVYCF